MCRVGVDVGEMDRLRRGLRRGYAPVLGECRACTSDMGDTSPSGASEAEVGLRWLSSHLHRA